MPIPTNRMSYTDCYEIFDKAQSDPKGIRIPFNTEGEARHYQMRLHNARAVDRRENTKIYDKGHQLYGQSAYDILQVRLRQGEDFTWFVYIEPKDKYIDKAGIEMLSEVETEDQIDGQTTT